MGGALLEKGIVKATNIGKEKKRKERNDTTCIQSLLEDNFNGLLGIA